MKIYISGPMTGLKGFNYHTFNVAACRLRDKGFEVVNPAEINEPGKAWLHCMREDIKAMMDCDTVLYLPGSENSRGAKIELVLAFQLGLDVREYESFINKN
jgi:hypothetical protein